MDLISSWPRPIVRECTVERAWVCHGALTTVAESDKRWCRPIDSNHITPASSADHPSQVSGGYIRLTPSWNKLNLFQSVLCACIIDSGSTFPSPPRDTCRDPKTKKRLFLKSQNMEVSEEFPGCPNSHNEG